MKSTDKAELEAMKSACDNCGREEQTTSVADGTPFQADLCEHCNPEISLEERLEKQEKTTIVLSKNILKLVGVIEKMEKQILILNEK